MQNKKESSAKNDHPEGSHLGLDNERMNISSRFTDLHAIKTPKNLLSKQTANLNKKYAHMLT